MTFSAIIIFLILPLVAIPVILSIALLMIKLIRRACQWMKKQVLHLRSGIQAREALTMTLQGKSAQDNLKEIEREFVTNMFGSECMTELLELANTKEDITLGFLDELQSLVEQMASFNNRWKIPFVVASAIGLTFHAFAISNISCSLATPKNFLSGKLHNRDAVMPALFNCIDDTMATSARARDTQQYWNAVQRELSLQGYPYILTLRSSSMNEDQTLAKYFVNGRGLTTTFNWKIIENQREGMCEQIQEGRRTIIRSRYP